MRVVVAPDKFKGTATAAEMVDAVRAVAVDFGIDCIGIPMADGGEGTLDALGGPNRSDLVVGPLGTKVIAPWRLDGSDAVIEMAHAAGLVVAGGAEANDPLVATTRGVGELISLAASAGASSIVIGVGGSATSDGGWGALHTMGSPEDAQITVACDVSTRFVDAATVFGPQKGASPEQVLLLTRRLEFLAALYEDEFGVDVRRIEGSGAAGGLGGGLAAVGAELVDGFDLIAERVGLVAAVEKADLVITGEGMIDDQSFAGKVVGGVCAVAGRCEVACVAIAGQVRDDRLQAISLSDRFGLESAMADPLGNIAIVTAELFENW